jgi:hypothetical protein
MGWAGHLKILFLRTMNHLIFYVTRFSIGWSIGWIFESIDLWRNTQTS